MAIKEAIQIINRMEADGVIERYAIGGAVGATFYLEPVATLDVDVFIEFRAQPGSRLVSLEPIFTYLRDRGCTMEGEHIVIAGWPVQFLPANSNLLQEALVAAVEKSVEGTSARVFTAEPIAEKLRLLDSLRERMLAIRRGSNAVATRKTIVQETPSER